MCYKTKRNQTKPNQIKLSLNELVLNKDGFGIVYLKRLMISNKETTLKNRIYAGSYFSGHCHCNIGFREFKLLLRNCVHIRSTPLEKGI